MGSKEKRLYQKNIDKKPAISSRNRGQFWLRIDLKTAEFCRAHISEFPNSGVRPGVRKAFQNLLKHGIHGKSAKIKNCNFNNV